MFAKLFESDVGQILVKMDFDSDGNPEIRFYFKPENLGVCSIALTFEDSDDGFDKQELAFNELDFDECYKLVKGTIDRIPQL